MSAGRLLHTRSGGTESRSEIDVSLKPGHSLNHVSDVCWCDLVESLIYHHAEFELDALCLKKTGIELVLFVKVDTFSESKNVQV